MQHAGTSGPELPSVSPGSTATIFVVPAVVVAELVRGKARTDVQVDRP
ncbi:MAG: hypothetical protein ACRDX8_13125 [Acidimicrobiales bacterium]